MIIFLDIDGVLHPLLAEPPDHLSCMPRLAGVLRDYPSVRVVISSTWRLTRSFDQLQDLFPPDLRERVIGVTPQSDYKDRAGCREWEAMAWLEQNAAGERWVALDDYAPGYFSLWLVVLCQDGFGEKEEIELRRHLATVPT